MTELMIVAVLISVRVSCLLVFAPIFSSKAIPPRVKAGFVLAMTLLLTPAVAGQGGTHDLNPVSLLGELAAGFVFGFTLSLLNEALVFAGQLLGMHFSFSLANLMDPNSMVETPVLGQLLSWLGILVLLASGLHRTMIAAMIQSFRAVPVGTAVIHAQDGLALSAMVGGTLIAGLQLAAPVISAALMIEAAMALLARVSPQLPVMAVNIPVKTLVCYGVLIGSLALWPAWMESYFTHLLHTAGKLVHA